MQGDEEEWTLLRRAYETTSDPLTHIAQRFDVTVQRIVARARREGWAARKPERGRAKRRVAGKAAPSLPRSSESGAGLLPTRGSQRALLGRLFRAISLKLEHMEKRMASGEVRSVQDEERESRALATLISNFEKVTEAVAGLDNERGGSRGRDGASADAERMRREIAERLERLGGGGPAEPAPRDP